jgi:hypothetical protein
MMKNKIVWLLLPLVFFGCSKKISVVVSPETKEMRAIDEQAMTLLQEKNYDGLDAYAKKMLDSKERYDGGAWKFYFVYDGLNLPGNASDADWAARLAALQDWVNVRPDSITARVALANDLVSYAWKARGSDWASTVTDERWQLFGQRLNEAVKVLNAAQSLKEHSPLWWSVMMQAELGLSYPRPLCDATFKDATLEWPDYTPYYNRRAIYLLPRWHGTPGEWESDLNKSADRIGGEAGDLLYARVVWCIHQTHAYDNMFRQCALSWSRVNQGFEIMEKQFPDSIAAKSEHAYLATLAEDNAVARKYFDELGGKVDLSVWLTKDAFIELSSRAYSNGK